MSLFCWFPLFLDFCKNFQIFGVIFWKILEAKNSIWNYLTFKAKVFFAKSEIKSEQIKDELSGSQPEFEVILTLLVEYYQFTVYKTMMFVAYHWPGLFRILIFFEMEGWENVTVSKTVLTLFHFKRSENILLTCSLNGL